VNSLIFRTLALTAWIAGTSVSCAQPAQIQKATWSTDWATYIREASKVIETESPSNGAAALNLVGKQVEWSGTVRTIQRPGPKETNAHVNLVMPEAPISMGVWGSGKVNQIGLRPKPDEWKSWEGVSAGDKVVFRTTLSEGIGGGNPTMERAAKVGVIIAILNDKATPLISAEGGTLISKVRP